MVPDMKTSFGAAGAIAVTACSGNPYVPIVDGLRCARFQQDLASCRQVSQQKKTANEGSKRGAILGGVIGSADENSKNEDACDKIIISPMRGRGHNVVG